MDASQLTKYVLTYNVYIVTTRQDMDCKVTLDILDAVLDYVNFFRKKGVTDLRPLEAFSIAAQICGHCSSIGEALCDDVAKYCKIKGLYNLWFAIN